MVNIRSTGMIARYLAWFGLIALLFILFASRLGGFAFDPTQPMIGTVLVVSGLLIGLETVFRSNFGLANPRSATWLVGVISAFISVMLGLSYLLDVQAVIAVLSGFEGGIYLTAAIILLFEGATALTGFEM